MSTNFKPTKQQLEFLDWEFGTFFHFGIRTFNEHHRDWDMKPMVASSFNPTELDCEQWIRTIKSAGVKYAVMTTKHHDGFALWPSKFTEYSVKNPPEFLQVDFCVNLLPCAAPLTFAKQIHHFTAR